MSICNSPDIAFVAETKSVSENQFKRRSWITFLSERHRFTFAGGRAFHYVANYCLFRVRYTWITLDVMRAELRVSLIAVIPILCFISQGLRVRWVLSLARAATSVIFVLANICNFIATKVLSRQAYFCRVKHVFVATKMISLA